VKELTSRIKGIGQLVGERNLDKARERDRKLLAECGGVVKPMPRQNVQPALVHGCLDPEASAGTGTLFPQAWLKQVRMDDLWGCGWRVVLSADASADFARLLAKPAYSFIKTMKLGAVDAIEADGVMAAWLQAHSCQAALVRPDHYVFGTAQTSAQLHRQLQQLGHYVEPHKP
jgi:3-(3-hydroxy-phenyl)propionate hydroxylase